jgi:hypothetical protein
MEQEYPPEIDLTEAEPAKLVNDQARLVVFKVQVTDNNGLFDIKRVTIDLTPVLGDPEQKMYDNGKFGDMARGDGIYSYEYMVPDGLPSGTKTIEITVTDHSDNEITSELYLEIEEKKSGKSSQANFLPGFEIELIIFTFGFVILLELIKRTSKS